MNRTLVKGMVAGVAAIALAAGGSAYAAFSDFANIAGNSVGAGFLKLDLGPDGSGVAPLDFAQLAPGSYTGRTIWIASNDGRSVPDANLSVTFGNLVDTPGSCSVSLGKAQAEAASGISGCAISDNVATGTPAQGNLSRVLSFQGYYYPAITDPADCQALQDDGSYPADRTAFFASGRGDLYTAAAANGGRGTTFPTYATGTTPLALHPGDGVCIGIGAGWIASPAKNGTPSTPTDDAAQGDSLSFGVRFDLTEVS